MSSNVFQINQTQKADISCHKCPSATPQKMPHLHHQLHCLSIKTKMFLILPDLCGLFRPLHWSEFLRRENRKEIKGRKKFLTLPPPLSVYFSLFLSSLLAIISLLFLHTTNPSLLLVHLFFIFISISIYSLSWFPLSLCASQPIYLYLSFDYLQDQNFFLEKALLLFFDLMSKKYKGVVLDSTTSYGVSVSEDAKARLKYQTLVQDFQELQKETSVVRSKLEAVKKRKLMLAAEVWFLRQRYKCLVKTKAISSSQVRKLVQPPNLLKLHKNNVKEQIFSRKEATLHRVPPFPDPKPKMKHHIGKDITPSSASLIIYQHHKHTHRKEAIRRSVASIADMNHKGIHIRKESLARNATPFLDSNHKKRLHGADDTAFRNSIAGFDLNQDNSGKEASLPNRAPIFDLNEISTGDEDFDSNGEAIKFEEAKKGLLRCISDEQQNDLKLSMCRNAGEGSSRVGKRKISWQDPVALRV